MDVLLKAIWGKLSGSTLWTLVGGRVYLERAPQNTEFPYVVFFIISDLPEYPGNKTMEDILMQFSIFSTAAGSVEINAILSALRTLYDDCTLTMAGETLIYFIRANFTSIMEEISTPSGTVGVKHYAQEYELSTVK